MRTYDGVALGAVDDGYWIALGDHYMEQSAQAAASLSYLSDGAIPGCCAKAARAAPGEAKVHVCRLSELLTKVQEDRLRKTGYPEKTWYKEVSNPFDLEYPDLQPTSFRERARPALATQD